MLSALGFLTVVPGTHRPDERTLRWFPVVGALLGAILAAVWIGASAVFSPAVAAILVIAADLVLTGMLHVDGLADSADGLLPHLERERRLEVMRTPDVGAFALAIVPVVMLARWVALAGDLIDPEALIAVWAASRTSMAVIPVLVPYARPAGLASPFLAGARHWHALWLVPVGVLLVICHQTTGLIALAVGIASVVMVVVSARRRLGGFTGDVLGAAAVIMETAMLLVLTAR
ncbi:adenosylcobinamide-GDP ribazoletransferase [Actinospongicola halichondriae]|uniref:adenosylcobinamide-GDP ribazoletransferase n=1 Tax=Actinospongicola halichondriae TaxID=3236844 RepID=UPI003D52AB3C